MRNIIVLGFFPDKNHAFLKKLCENFNVIMFESQFAKSFRAFRVQFVEEIVEVNRLKFPRAEFSWEMHQTVNQIEEQLADLLPENKTKVSLREHEFTTLNNVAFPIYWHAFLFLQIFIKGNIIGCTVNHKSNMLL